MDRKEKFLIKLKKTHGDNIDTSKVEYVNSQTKVCLICHKKDKNGIEHGEFWQAPADTVRGRGCPKCGYNLSKAGDDIISFIKDELHINNIIQRELPLN